MGVSTLQFLATSTVVALTINFNLQSLVTLHSSYHRYNVWRTVCIAVVSYYTLAVIARCTTALGKLYFSALFLLIVALSLLNLWMDCINFDAIHSAVSAVVTFTPICHLLVGG